VSATTPQAGFSSALRRLLRNIAALASSRIESVRSEVNKQLKGIADVVLSSIIVALSAMLAVVFGFVGTLIAAPASWRAPACGGIAMIFIVIAVSGGYRIRSRLRSLRTLNWATVVGYLAGSAKLGIAERPDRCRGNYG
jgi:Putative Actinobacterial Holin-X, holin superfamily III